MIIRYECLLYTSYKNDDELNWMMKWGTVEEVICSLWILVTNTDYYTIIIIIIIIIINISSSSSSSSSILLFWPQASHEQFEKDPQQRDRRNPFTVDSGWHCIFMDLSPAVVQKHQILLLRSVKVLLFHSFLLYSISWSDLECLKV